MDEAFLLQMNDFDRFLETNLRRMLDPVAATRPPARGQRPKTTSKPVLAIEPPAGGLAVEPIPIVEPVVVAAAALQQL